MLSRLSAANSPKRAMPCSVCETVGSDMAPCLVRLLNAATKDKLRPLSSLGIRKPVSLPCYLSAQWQRN